MGKSTVAFESLQPGEHIAIMGGEDEAIAARRAAPLASSLSLQIPKIFGCG